MRAAGVSVALGLAAIALAGWQGAVAVAAVLALLLWKSRDRR